MNWNFLANKYNQLTAKILVVTIVVVALLRVGFVEAAAPTLMLDTLDRIKISESATHSLSMTLPGAGITPANTGTLLITYTGFGSDFAGTPVVTCGTGTATAGFATNVLTLTSGATACSGTLTVTPFTGTNPGSAGSYTISVATGVGGAGIGGQFAIAIVDDDQVVVSATVESSITFNVGTQAAPGSTCTGSFAGNGGSLDLGTLTTGAITSSDVSSVNHICSRVSTNASNGVNVTVESLNASLQSVSVPADYIPSATAAMAAGTANYGLCASATRRGMDTTDPVGAMPAAVSPFIASCVEDTAAGSVGALTISPQIVWATSGPVANAYYNLVIKAAISGTIPAHNDYADTLTFVATGTF